MRPVLRTRSSRTRAGTLAAAALIGVALTAFATRHGIGVGGPDSAAYLAIASNMLHGRGVSMPFTIPTAPYRPVEAVRLVGHVPVTHFPPLYPIALWLIAAPGVPLATGARLLNVALAGISAALLAELTRRCTGSLAVGFCAGVLMFFAPVQHNPIGFTYNWLALHSLVLSEPLFVAFVMLTLLVLLRAIAAPTVRNVSLAAGFAALATLIRFAGVSLIVAGAVAVLLFAGDSWKRRRRLTLLFIAVAAVPVMLWALWIAAKPGGGGARAVGVHTLPFGSIFTVMEAWFMPLAWPAPLRHALGFALVGIVVAAVLKCRNADRPTMQVLIVLSVFVTIYAATIVATRDFLDISTPIDARLLIPAQPIAYVVVITAVMRLVARDAGTVTRHPRVAVIGVAVCVLLALVGSRSAVDFARRGFGRSAPLPTMALLDRVPQGALVATNDPYAIFLATGRPSVVLPSRTSWTSGNRNAQFPDDVAALISLIRSRRGAVVLAPVNFANVRLANEADLTRGGLRVVARAPDGGALLEP
jgi:hypothetical protein